MGSPLTSSPWGIKTGLILTIQREPGTQTLPLSKTSLNGGINHGLVITVRRKGFQYTTILIWIHAGPISQSKFGCLLESSISNKVEVSNTRISTAWGDGDVFTTTVLSDPSVDGRLLSPSWTVVTAVAALRSLLTRRSQVRRRSSSSHLVVMLVAASRDCCESLSN